MRLHELDPGGNLSPLSICNFLQSAASNHAQALGISLEKLQSTGHTWVLAWLKLHMAEYPKGNAPVRIQTWPAGIHRLYALREFRIYDETDRLVGKAGSAWLILDMQRRRPVRVEPFGESIHQISSPNDVSADMGKIQTLTVPSFSRDFRVRYRDLDVNQHVNNVSYVEWALESLPAELLTTACLVDLEVNYLGEAHLGDTVLSRAQSLNDTRTAFVHDIIRRESGDSLIKATSVWTPKTAKRQ